MEIVTAYLAGILTAGILWFLMLWLDVARDPELETIYLQRAEEDRMRHKRRRAEAEDESVFTADTASRA
ncbi:hypothetical protein WL78_23945 [Burkholderia ubonensis]|uniref:hypothetical protein n=1 Tax=Burkholderia ubonensis TaxID=101571 RepID=UPI00075583F2|nr:hypothetical protein [Burkholderia ubonensis]KVP18850.1 hypothetical protein WJ84_00320 [Burkholderia ubonensis]KWE64927.1 hypothetical protein WL78_23945 [Burkholderia ubonensis]